ncbi:MAG: BadF/BadG/BcrA/BcrD ATPase family protein [Verrucomicrobiota bacterium]|nr:BadF/BadG/BcrA/BcrD ATPase family protein [Verrucomicrobiota bacterium]
MHTENSKRATIAVKPLYLGVDGGGSKTRAWLADEKGTVLGQGVGGSANINYTARTNAIDAIRAACTHAFKSAHVPESKVSSAWLGLAGMARNCDRDWIREQFSELAIKVGVSDDLHIAHCGGLAGDPGIVLVAGTGSACYGRDYSGKTWRCGGWGSLADDAGSASWLSQRAFQLAVRQADGRATGNAIKHVVFDFLKIRHSEDFSQAVESLSRCSRAQICPQLSSLYHEGDPLVKKLYREAAFALSEMITVTAKQLNFSSPKVILSGAIASGEGPLHNLLCKELEKRLPKIQLCEPLYSPCAGALMEAYRMNNIDFSFFRINHFAT